MKILQVNAVYKNASTGRMCEELHDYFVACGHSCTTAYGGEKGDYKDTLYMGSSLDHKLHAFLSRLFGKVGYYSTLPTMRLIRHLKKNRPDVVHLNVLHSNFVNIPMFLRYLGEADIPTVITLHDCFFFTGKCCHYMDVQCEKWKSECGHCPSYKKWNKSWFFDQTMKMQSDKKRLYARIPRLAVVGVSNWITEEARQATVFTGKRVLTIYNGVDLSIFKPVPNGVKSKLGIEGRIMLLGVATDWGDQKGLCDFIRLAEVLPPERYAVVLIGSLPDSRELPDTLVAVKRTNSTKELAEYYSAADIFLQLSRQETFGKVTAEAMACGTPVITYGNTANREMAFDGCGLCVQKTGDVDELIHSIESIASAGKACYSENCRSTAERLFNRDRSCDAYLKLYQEISTE